MKTLLGVAVVAVTQLVGRGAQPSSPPGNPCAGTNGLAWRATARDGVPTTWEAVETVSNALTGTVTNVPHRYVEIASGLNYLDPATGQYQPSQDRMELTADGGAAALHGPAKLSVKPNLNTVGAITIVTASNRVFQTRPVGLFWYNAQSGQAVLVAPVQDCVGELVPPNQVVFKSAFGPLADLRLVYTKSGIESDLVLLQAPTLPTGWNPQTTRLELWHDWTGSPTPRLTPRRLWTETNATLRSQMSEPDLTDQILDFGDLWFPTGAAYATDGSPDTAPNAARQVRVPNLVRDAGLVGVAKTWLDTPQRTVLVEGVRWADVQAKVQALPPAAPSLPPALPQDRRAWLSQLPAPGAANSPMPAMTQATTAYHPAGLLDYQTVPSSWWGDYTFASGTTYLVTSTTYFGGGTVTFQPGCVIKFGGGYLLLYEGIVCNGRDWMPSILTSKDDDVYGQTDYGSNGTSTHCPTYVAGPAIWDYYITNNVSLIGMKIRWAQTAIEFDGSGDPDCNGYPDCCGETNSVTECSLEFCQTGILVNRCVASIANSAMCSVATPTASEWTCQWCPTFFGSLIDACSGNDGCYGGLLPLVWECKYFGHFCVPPTGAPGTAGDPDGDGFNNFQEFQNGSDPIWPWLDTANSQTVFTPVGQPANIILTGTWCGTPVFSFPSLPQNGSLDINQAPIVTYTPNPNYAGEDGFQFNVGDSLNPGSVFICVVPAPVLTTDCRPNRIDLQWTVPDWMNGLIQEFRIYRCGPGSGNCTPTTLYQTITDSTKRSYVDWVQDNNTYCYQVSVVLAPGTPPYESPRSSVECNQRCSVPEVLITGNNANSCGAPPIDTYDFGDGIQLNSFTHQSWLNGRGIAISAGQIYYTEIDNNNATYAIQICSYGTDGSGSPTDSGSIPNPNSSLGIQDLDFSGGYLYAMRGWGTQTPEVIKIDPSSGAQIGNAIQIQQNQGYPTARADGFVVLPTTGNFLINQDDRSPIYQEYDKNSGALVTGGLTVNLSAYGEATGVATDGQYLYFAILAGEGCVSQTLVQTDLNGNFIRSQPIGAGHFEDIEVVVQ